MLKKQNLHIHTTFGDGKSTQEELVLEAIDRGFSSIGFSEHSYMAFSDYPHQMTVEKTEDYKKEARALKEKYRGRLDIFCGLELEFFSELPTEDFDYVIGSVHYLEVDGRIVGFDRGLPEVTAYIQDNFGGDSMAFARKYYETLARLPEKGRVDIIGHFDVLTKNNEKGNFLDTSAQEYLDMGFAAIRALQGKIPFFEVNTGPIPRGYRSTPYPQMEFLKELHRCGFGAIITTDCHNKAYLDSGYDVAVQRLRQAGFTTYWLLTDNGFQEEAL